MINVELLISKYRNKIIFIVLVAVLFAINPYKIYNENRIKDMNDIRVVIEKEFDKNVDVRDNELIKTSLKKISDYSPALLNLIMVNNSFKNGEYKSMKLDMGIYGNIESDALKNIVELEIAIENKDIAMLEELHNKIVDEDLKDYIVYIIKTIAPNHKIEFKENSKMRHMYLG